MSGQGRTAALAAVSLLAALAGPSQAAGPCALDRVDLRWEGGKQSFAVELADDSAERARGLMGRESMAPDAGMLFVYEGPRRAMFWMKDTLIPLDMIFADARGVVTRVKSNAQPLDLSPVDGGEGVQYVLEINGGLAERLGIGPGAELRHPAIAAPAWPCD